MALTKFDLENIDPNRRVGFTVERVYGRVGSPNPFRVGLTFLVNMRQAMATDRTTQKNEGDRGKSRSMMACILLNK
jgi:hypothetical protein